jgi:hypothetical protein
MSAAAVAPGVELQPPRRGSFFGVLDMGRFPSGRCSANRDRLQAGGIIHLDGRDGSLELEQRLFKYERQQAALPCAGVS